MKTIKLTAIAAALALAFGSGAFAAADTTKDESKATSTPAPAKSTAKAGKKESAGEYVDDSVITTKVKAAIFEESSLKSTEINVETYKGIVQLTGFVGSAASIDKAVKLAHGVKGVKSVKNDMIVKGKK